MDFVEVTREVLTPGRMSTVLWTVLAAGVIKLVVDSEVSHRIFHNIAQRLGRHH